MERRQFLQSIGVAGLGPAQNAGPSQKIMHQRIDRDESAADLPPGRVMAVADHQ